MPDRSSAAPAAAAGPGDVFLRNAILLLAHAPRGRAWRPTWPRCSTSCARCELVDLGVARRGPGRRRGPLRAPSRRDRALRDRASTGSGGATTGCPTGAPPVKDARRMPRRPSGRRPRRPATSPGERRGRGRGGRRGRRRPAGHRPGRLQRRRGAAPPRLRPHDRRRSCARRRGSSTASCRSCRPAGRGAGSSTGRGGAAPRGPCCGATWRPAATRLTWLWRRPARRPRSVVLICDISGSMERHARLLLRFGQALARSEVRTEAFVFGTRLTRVTPPAARPRPGPGARPGWRPRSPTGPAGRASAASFREFNQRWARRVLRTSGIVIVVSDGWDRGDAELVGSETARLRRNCHRLVWLNPLAGAADYRPLAAGMAAAYPYLDVFLPANDLASLERLGELLTTDASRRRRSRPLRRTAPRARRRDRAAMRELLDALRAWQAEGVAVGRAVVVRTFGSAPRPEGAVLLGRRATGGWPARSAAAAWRARRTRRSSRRARDRALARHPLRHQRRAGVGRGPGLRRHHRRAGGARACVRSWSRPPATRLGGRSSRRCRPTRPAPSSAPLSRAKARRRRRAARRGCRRPAARGGRRRPRPRGAGRRGATSLARGRVADGRPGDGRSWFVEAFPRRPRLVIVGAVQVAIPLVAAGAHDGLRDGRGRRARRRSLSRERFPDADRLVVGWPDEVADEIGLGPDDAVAVLSTTSSSTSRPS